MEGWRLKLGVGALSRRDTSETPVRATGPPDPPVDNLLEHRSRTRVRFLCAPMNCWEFSFGARGQKYLENYIFDFKNYQFFHFQLILNN